MSENNLKCYGTQENDRQILKFKNILEDLYKEISKMTDSPVELLPDVWKDGPFEYKVGVKRGLVIAENLILEKINENKNQKNNNLSF